MADLGTFLAVFPEFQAQAGAAPFWLGIAQAKFSLRLLGQAQYDLAVYLFMAHNLVFQAKNAEATSGASAGTVFGPTSSKAAGGLSVGYDTSAVTEAGAAAYNATTYGTRLQSLLAEASVGKFIHASPPQRRHSLPFGPPYPWQ